MVWIQFGSALFVLQRGSDSQPTTQELGFVPTFLSSSVPDGNGKLYGTPQAGTSGRYDMLATAIYYDSANDPHSVRQTFLLTVYERAKFTSPQATINVGALVPNITLAARGYPRPTIRANTPLPSGLTLTINGNGTVAISGVAPSGSAGDYSFTACNEFIDEFGVLQRCTDAFTLHIYQPPAFSSGNEIAFSIGGNNSFFIGTSGLPESGTEIQITHVTRDGSDADLPDGVGFSSGDDGTAGLGGVPTAGQIGEWHLTLRAYVNGVFAGISQDLKLTVGVAPEFTSGTSDTFTAGTYKEFAVTATGDPAPAITVDSAALPAGVSFDILTYRASVEVWRRPAAVTVSQTPAGQASRRASGWPRATAPLPLVSRCLV